MDGSLIIPNNIDLDDVAIYLSTKNIYFKPKGVELPKYWVGKIKKVPDYVVSKDKSIDEVIFYKKNQNKKKAIETYIKTPGMTKKDISLKEGRGKDYIADFIRKCIKLYGGIDEMELAYKMKNSNFINVTDEEIEAKYKDTLISPNNVLYNITKNNIDILNTYFSELILNEKIQPIRKKISFVRKKLRNIYKKETGKSEFDDSEMFKYYHAKGLFEAKVDIDEKLYGRSYYIWTNEYEDIPTSVLDDSILNRPSRFNIKKKHTYMIQIYISKDFYNKMEYNVNTKLANNSFYFSVGRYNLNKKDLKKFVYNEVKDFIKENYPTIKRIELIEECDRIFLAFKNIAIYKELWKD